MRYDYEDAFEHFRPHYLTTGRKNPCRFRVTWNDRRGDYRKADVSNHEELQETMYDLAMSRNIDKDSVAIQNELGMLVWSKARGFAPDIKKPKYMDGMRILTDMRNWK